jgi:hypothetical protein
VSKIEVAEINVISILPVIHRTARSNRPLEIEDFYRVDVAPSTLGRLDIG